MAELRSGRLTRWLDTKDQLRQDTGTLDRAARRFYLTPTGFTLGQYLLAREIGEKPVSGSIRVGPGVHRLRGLDGGDVIVATLSTRTARAMAELQSLLADIGRSHLRPISVPALLAATR